MYFYLLAWEGVNLNFIEVSVYQAKKDSIHVYVLGASILPISSDYSLECVFSGS
jgi:hypothetical protein